jgi:hypothetical protein
MQPPFALITALHTLCILSSSFTCNAFAMVLKDFPHANHLLAAFSFNLLANSSQTISIGLRSVIVEAMSSDAAFHHSSSWSNSPYTAWQCVGSLSCLKINDSPTKSKPVALLSF